MLALTMTVALFAFWAFLGYGVLAVLPSRLRVLTNMLLAPAVGVAATLIPLFVVNRGGVPVRSFAWPLLAGLGLAAVAALARVRPLVTARRYLPFAGLLCANLLFVGRPMLDYGFDWVSYCNDDMANYCLSAARFADHGFFEVPTAEGLRAGRDYSEWYWFMHAPGMVRAGSDLLLAWSASLTGLSPHAVFMPTILALNLGLVSAGSAFVFSTTRSRRAALAGCLLLAFSSLTGLGVAYQLIGQVGGLCLLLANLTVFLRPVRGGTLRAQLRPGLLAALLLTGLTILYPEVLPFLGLGYLMYAGSRWRRGAFAWRARAWQAAVVAVAFVGLSGRHAADSVSFLLNQSRTGATGRDEGTRELFPYMLVPMGLGNLWGAQTITLGAAEPRGSLTVLCGAALLAGVIGFSLRPAWRGAPVPQMTLAMFGLGVLFFVKGEGFSLFKLAMFVQPFLLPAFALLCGRLARRAWVGAVPVVALAALNGAALADYVRLTKGDGVFAEVREGSSQRVCRQFAAAVAAHPDASCFVLDSHNVVLAKFQALYTRGKPAHFLADRFFRFSDGKVEWALLPPPCREESERLVGQLGGMTAEAALDLMDPADPGAANGFTFNQAADASLGAPGAYFVGTTGSQTAFNRRHLPPGPDAFDVRPLADVRNRLAFVSSELGRQTCVLYIAKRYRNHFGFSPLEGDYFYPGATIQALGRHLLFQVVGPTERFRVVFNFSASFRVGREGRLPPAAAVGDRRVPLPLCGRGSARVVSEPVAARAIAGRGYLGLDLGERGRPYESVRAGLNRLWGEDLSGDLREPVGFARDISLITEEEYRALSPPALLEKFPGALAHPDLEYSGIYEDGWAGEALYAVLNRPAGPADVVLRGEVWAGGRTEGEGNEVEVLVDGRPLGRRALPPGPFELRLPAGANSGGRGRIELRFATVYRLPDDDRPVSARLLRFGFEAGGGAPAGPKEPR